MRGITIAILLTLCRSVYAQQSAIEGTAIDTTTHRPMAGVHITLRPMGTNGQPSEDSVTYGALSRKDGHFSISGIAPAVYFLQAEHNGYVLVPGKSATISLKPGEQRADVTIAMSPRGVIVGHILDEYGDPVQRWQTTQVMATPASGSSTAPVYSDPTDERGLFRLPVAPGKYYVSAQLVNTYMPYEIRNDGRSTSAYSTTWYPSAGSEDQATPVTVAAGQTLDGIDIHLTRSRRYTIEGTVTGIPEGTGVTAVWALSESGGARTFRCASGGKFTASGLAAGRYRLIAVAQIGDVTLQSEMRNIEAGGTSETDVNLTLRPPAALSGTLVVEGGPPRIASAEKLTIRLESNLPLYLNPKGTDVAQDGTFTLAQLFPAKFSVGIAPMPENAFIKSVKVDGVQATGDELDFSRGIIGSAITVTLSRNGGIVEGKVLDADSQAFVAIAQSADDLDYRSLVPVGPGAKFHFAGLRTGKYRIIAVDATQFSGVYQHDSRALRALFPAAPEIEIHEGDRIETDVKLTASEKQGAKQ